ncbi:NADPH:quinone oxidoreductase family protein [Nocardia yunnanensis]|uniref:NADPH:quinone oxidoreductase family protein n=1 Tax=Nocardia yunnanensis TaxID=2382165 RepID=A0A386ZKS8_9NOCA|nr:zinc-binding dehydrogenase [Nocardia yunnanensis]AYF78056.1 NADPH:quinone oxidoreductase family protein [Nocardia yunnanensis]
MSIPTTMRALVQGALEGPGGLGVDGEVAVPWPRAGEVLVRVAVAGVNFRDVMQGRGTSPGGPRPPFVAGFEGVGEVVALGEGVSGPGVGTHVMGVGDGAFAEYMVLPAAAAVPVPPGWTDLQAVGMLVNLPTALAALRPLGGLAAGETVLIQAAAGGVGQAAVRMAKHYGAQVIATASAAKHDAVRALGADHVLDSRGDNLAKVRELTGGLGVDLVLECAGGEGFDASLALAKPVTGRVVVYGLAGGISSITNQDLVYRHPIHLIGFNLGTLIQAAPQLFGEVMGELFALVAAGVVTPTEPTAYDLADGAMALAELENRSSTGKLALLP